MNLCRIAWMIGGPVAHERISGPRHHPTQLAGDHPILDG